jgi:predicted protein tyrosine phosphatase
MPEIKIMSIQDLLHLHALKNSLKIAIVFVTTKPNYYDFGWTKFLQVNIADTDAPTITNCDLARLSYFVKKESKEFEIVYVCCDAGLSRSPAVAYFIATKIGELKQAREISDKYHFLNTGLYRKLMVKVEC